QALGGSALEEVGKNIAGLPRSIADQLLGRNVATELLDRAANAILPERARQLKQQQDLQTQQLIENTFANRALQAAGKELASRGQQIGAGAGEGFIPDVERSLGAMLPSLATGPLALPTMMAQAYTSRRGEGGSPTQAAIGAGTTALGLGAGSELGRLGT